MPRQFYLFFSLPKKLCIESTLKSVAGICTVTDSHSKKSWGHPDKSGESGTLDSSNGDISYASLFLSVLQKSVYLPVVPTGERGLAGRDWKRLDKLCACWSFGSEQAWQGYPGGTWSPKSPILTCLITLDYLLFQSPLGHFKGISMLNQISDKGQLVTETVRNTCCSPLHHSLPTPNLT